VTSTVRTPVVVIGLGNPMRRDDGVGPAVIEAFEDQTPPFIELLLTDGEPTRLLEAWRGRKRAIVVDTIVAGAPAGTVHRVELGVDAIPASRPNASSHEAGIEVAVDLSRVLDALPAELIVFGIEPDDVGHGEGLSAVVAASLPALLDRIRTELH